MVFWILHIRKIPLANYPRFAKSLLKAPFFSVDVSRITGSPLWNQAMFDRPFGPILTGTYEEITTYYHEIDPPGGESSDLDGQILSIVTLLMTNFPRKLTWLAGHFSPWISRCLSYSKMFFPIPNVSPIYKPFSPFGRGLTLLRGLTNHGYYPFTKWDDPPYVVQFCPSSSKEAASEVANAAAAGSAVAAAASGQRGRSLGGTARWWCLGAWVQGCRTGCPWWSRLRVILFPTSHPSIGGQVGWGSFFARFFSWHYPGTLSCK